jgi:putative transposase
VDKGNRRTQSAFICLTCGHAENADVNAAKNILAAGHAATACEEDVRRVKPVRDKRAASAKQESTEETCHD